MSMNILPKHILLFSLLYHSIINLADSKCQESFQCGNFTMEFPLTGADNPGCGLIPVSGCNSSYPYPTVYVGGEGIGYTILEKESTHKLVVKDLHLEAQLSSRSCFNLKNLSLLQSPSISFSFSPNLTLLPCFTEFAPVNNTISLQVKEHFPNYSSIDCVSSTGTVYYNIKTTDAPPVPVVKDIPDECSSVQLPIKYSPNSDDLFDMLTAEFSLEWNVSQECLHCFNGGGRCLTDSDNVNRFYCSKGSLMDKNVIFIGSLTTAALISTLIIIFLFIRRMRAKEKQEKEKDIEIFLKNNGNILAPTRYKYSSIKKMTNSFAEILGKGGYGSVYKGKFPDGHLVAVKVLNESGGNGEEFMNEVASISRTSHINIVALLGFCFEGSKRALIYDFMPNGSLEKFIGSSNNASPAADQLGLGWEKLCDIALGIARGLEYLHQGCNTRILHLDIKPQNILLDKDFNPRISDFGLAKLCPNRSSIVSMMVARGTIGYIAPEVFSRNFGEVSYKSDVYSYGMLVLDMIGGRKNIDPRDVDHTSEIYFPNYIYKQLEMDAERDIGDIVVTMNEDDESQVVKKRNLIIVGLWCIQTNPKDRPTMTKVVEMLEGKLGALEVPPKPYLCSPPRSAQHTFATTSTSESL